MIDTFITTKWKGKEFVSDQTETPMKANEKTTK